MTVDFALRLASAAARVLAPAGGQVLIGKDTRVSGYMFESALEAGFVAAGVDVLLLGPLPTPGIAYLTKKFDADFGIVISASHNPYQDNGIKFFDGEGAKLAGGRWNSKGVSVAYAADSIALAALEVLVHIHSHEILNHYRLCSIEFEAADVLTLDTRDIPRDWRADPLPRSTAQLGYEWVKSQASLALMVPSVVIPKQHILLINPAYRDFKNARKTIRNEPFVFDPRLVKTTDDR